MAGTVELLVDGQPSGRADLALYMRMMSSVGPSVGYDHGSAVSTRYEAPFAYTGDLEQVVIEAGKKPSDTADVEARTEMGRQ